MGSSLMAALTVAVLLGAATSSIAQEGNPTREAQQSAPAEDSGVDSLDLDADLSAAMGKVILIPPSAFQQDGMGGDRYFLSTTEGYVVSTNGAVGMMAPVMLLEGPPGS